MQNTSFPDIRKIIKEYHLFDAPPGQEYDDICRLAAYICHTPISLISIFDDKRQYVLSHHGCKSDDILDVLSFFTPESEEKGDFLEIKDTKNDKRQKNHSLFNQNQNVAYYAHVPLVASTGDVIGLFSVIDEKPGSLEEDQIEALRSLANQVIQLFELKRKEYQLYESREKLNLESARLSHIIDATQVGTWEWNVQTGIVKINDRWAEMIGYTREELEPLSIDFWYKNIHPKDREYSDKKVQECFKKEAEYYDIECRLKHKDDHFVWINDRGRVVSWTHDGEPLLMVGTHTDITERKNNEIQFRAITNNIPGVVYRYKRHADGSDELLLVSEGAKELWGISAADAMNDNQLIWQRYHEEDLVEHLNSIDQSAETNSYWEDEWRYHHPDGSLRWHKGSGTPTQLEDGSTIWDSIILDITEQKNSETRLTQTLLNLKERVKEQDCLNKITQLGNQDMGIEDLLTKAVKVLPQGWKYPEAATAEISFRKRTYHSKGHRKSKWMLSTSKTTQEGEELKISVAYQREMPEEVEGPFLKEERQLLESILNSLVLSIDKTVAAKKQELILNTTEEGIFGIDEDGLCTFINPSAAEMIGYTVRECLGLNMHELIHYKRKDGSNFEEMDCPIYSANRKLVGCRVESDIFWRKDGQSIPVRYSTTPILEDGEYRGAVIVFNDITDRIHFERALKENNERFELIMQASSECICDLDLSTDELYLSDGFTRHFGLEIKSLDKNKEYLNSRIHPDDRSEVLSGFNKTIYETDEESWTKEYRLKKGNGKYAVVRDKAIIMRNDSGVPFRVLGVMKDISEKYFYKELETIERDVMEYAIQPDVSLKEVVDQYLLKLESIFPGLSVSVLKVVDDCLQSLSAPSLPESYIEKLNGLQIGPKAGSCGTAAYNKSAVIVANVFEDERWEDYTALAREYDFTACWSQPIFNAKGEVIATFANYYDNVRTPDQLEEHAIVRAQRLISILMAKFRYVESIKKSNERFTYVNKATNDAIYDWDVKNDIFYWGESFTRTFGHAVEGSIFQLDDWAELVHPEDIVEAKESLYRFLNETDRTKWTLEYRFQRNDGTFAKVVEIGHLIRDKKGRPDRMIGVLRDVSDLRKLEELLDRANELARIGAWNIDLINDSIYWSPMTRKIHEVDEDFTPELEAGIGFYREEDRDKVRKSVSEAREKGTPFDFELPIITAKGNERWIRTIGQPEFVNGKCIRIYGSFQDIHQRKSAELAMQEALDERNNILESIGEAFFALNEVWEVLYWNSSAEDLIEVDRNELLGKNLWDKFPEAKNMEFYTQYDRAMKEKEPVHFEEYYPPFELWLEVDAYPNENGISVFFKDITEKKRSEERLREFNERFEKVTEATNDAIWDYDIVNNTLFWGKGFYSQFGYDPDNLKPTLDKLISLIHPEDREGIANKIKEFILDPAGINWFAEYRFRKSDGNFAFVIDRAIFIRNDDGKAIRAVGAMTDITYRKEYEDSLRLLNEEVEERARQLAMTNAELEQFAYVASHDLQEPLRMVISFLTQLEKKYDDVLDEKAQKYIHFAVDGAHRMRQIILDLLEYSRLGSHKDTKEEIPLRSIVDEVVKMFQRKIEKSGAKIHYENLPVVRSYHTPLLQIFQNLISNSLKYIDKGKSPEIHISGESQKNNWLIRIEDNGIGMDAEYFEKVFVIFQRLHAREEYSGTGMGLAIVKKNVEDLGGKIWVESQSGEGCTFYLSLPRKDNKTIKP